MLEATQLFTFAAVKILKLPERKKVNGNNCVLSLIIGREGWGREGAGLNCKFLGKNPQVHLFNIREWPKNDPPILRSPPAIRHEKVKRN